MQNRGRFRKQGVLQCGLPRDGRTREISNGVRKTHDVGIPETIHFDCHDILGIWHQTLQMYAYSVKEKMIAQNIHVNGAIHESCLTMFYALLNDLSEATNVARRGYSMQTTGLLYNFVKLSRISLCEIYTPPPRVTQISKGMETIPFRC